MLIPDYAPARTRIIVVRSLMRVPELTRFLDTPGLLVAACYYAHGVPGVEPRLARLREVASHSHRDLQKRLGLPSLRLLRKVTGDALWQSVLTSLSCLQADAKARRVLWHAPYLSATLIGSLATPVIRTRVSTHFLAEVGRTRDDGRRPRRSELRRLADFLAEYQPHKCIDSIAQYNRLLEDYKGLFSTHAYGMQRDPQFPPPPLAGEPGFIVPITTWKGLIRESIEMSNCVGADLQMWQMIRAGKLYIYRSEKSWGMPRATITVCKGQQWETVWRLGAARRHCNERMRALEIRSLALWIAEQQGLDDERLCLPVAPDA